MKEKLKDFWQKLKNLNAKKIADLIKENYKILLIGIAVIIVLIVAICTITHFCSSSSNPRKVVESYATSVAKSNDVADGFNYTLRCYKQSSDKYVEDTYLKQYIDTKAKKSEKEDNDTAIADFKKCMYNYFDLYYSLYSNIGDEFFGSYFSQMSAQKTAAFASTYMTKDFMLEIYHDNLKTYQDNYKKNFKSENKAEYNPEVSVSKKTNLTQKEAKDYLDSLSESFNAILKSNDLTKDDVKSVVTCDVTVKSGKKEINTKTYHIAKVKGKWYVIDAAGVTDDLNPNFNPSTGK